MLLLCAPIEGEDFDAERSTAERSHSLPPLDRGEALRDRRVLELDRDAARVLLGLVAVVLVREAARDRVTAEEDAGMKPRLGEHRRDMQLAVCDLVTARKKLGAARLVKALGVLDLDHPKTAKLPLGAIKAPWW